MTATLNHPGIVRIHSMGEAGGVPYLAYELVEGGSLQLADVDGWPLRERLALLLAVARAVGDAHDHGVVHRDLKPENVLLGPNGRPRVTDFGLGWCEGLERLTQSGAMIGTPLYMSPEQAAGSLGDMGKPTDVWALGVLLYRFATGEFPFEGETLLVLGARICDAEPVRPRQLDPAVSRGLQAVCLKCLEKEPEQRYSDAGAFAADLELALASRPVSAVAPPWWRVSAYRRVASLALVAVVVASGALAWGVHLASTVSEDELRRVYGEVRAGTSEPAELSEALAASRDGVDRALRAKVHLLLAQGDAGPPAVWASRLEHARAARELFGDEAGAAHRAIGRAQLALGQAAEAALSFGRARQAGEGIEALLEQVEAHARAGQLRAAEELGEELTSPEFRERFLVLVIPRLLEAGETARAEKLLRAGDGIRVGVLALRAQVARATGRDPLDVYEAAARRWPTRYEPLLGLALFQLEDGEVEAAWAAARSGQRLGGDDSQLPGLVSFLRASLACPPQREALASAEPTWRAGLASWSLARAERDMAYASRPPRLRNEGAIDADRRRRRAREAFELAAFVSSAHVDAANLGLARLAPVGSHERRALLEVLRARDPSPLARLLQAEEALAAGRAEDALAALRDLESAGRRGEVAWVRGRALRALSRPQEALTELSEACSQALFDPARLEELAQVTRETGAVAEASALEQRARRLAGSRRVDASELADRGAKGLDRAKLEGGQEVAALVSNSLRALELDPLEANARYYLGMGRVFEGRREDGLRETLLATSHRPELLPRLSKHLIRLTASFLGGDPFVQEDDETLIGGLRAVIALEAGQAGALSGSLEALDAVLAEDPDETVAWVLRSYAQIRAGRLALAARDLRVASEAAPGCALVHFYRGLLLAALQAEPADVLVELERAHQIGFDYWFRSPYLPVSYPEMLPYRGQPGFAPFFETRLGRQPKAPPTRAPSGALDWIRDGVVRGHASDPDTPGRAVTVRFFADGFAATGDLLGEAKTGGGGDDAFAFQLPPGAHGRLIYAVALNSGAGLSAALDGAPRLATGPR